MTKRTTAAHRRSGLNRHSRRRLFVLLASFGLAFILVGAKLVSIQGIGSRQYEEVSDLQSVRKVSLPALRGSILASDGDELALSEMRDLVFADPREISDAAEEAAHLAPVLHLDPAVLAREMSQRTTYVVLAAGISQTVGQAVNAVIAGVPLAGVGVEQDPVRYYPAGQLAGPVVGSLNDNGPTAGLELEYNKVLTGHDGRLVESVTPAGQPVPGTVTEDTPAINGDDVLTTIDEPLQYEVEQALAKAVVAAKGRSATAIVEQTHTGKLLAVASMVSNGKGGPAHEAPSSAAFDSVYEPGSVAKIVTISGALSSGVITPTSTFNIPDGYDVDGTIFHDAETHPDERLSITGILAQSSNIGALQIGERMGAESLFHYERAFGLTEPTDIDFPGQSAGLMPPLSQWSGTTLPTLSFGEAAAFTPVQMISAVNAVANGGVYVAPRLVTAIVGPTGKELPVTAPAPRRVVPAWVATSMARMLEQVVSNGTGLAAQVPGYTVSGKTGTANYVSHGVNEQSTYNSTFTGFLPSQDPQLTIMVVVDHTLLYGAEASAPTFSQVAKDAILDLEIPSEGPQPKASLASIPYINGQPDLAMLQPG